MPLPAMAPEVARAFGAYPVAVRRRLETMRRLIFETAAATPGVGALTETLKWAEPAYLTQATKSGVTVRLGWRASTPDCYGIYVTCTTNLVDTFRSMYPDELTFEGNRAIVLKVANEPPVAPLRACLSAALTYHRDKRGR